MKTYLKHIIFVFLAAVMAGLFYSHSVQERSLSSLSDEIETAVQQVDMIGQKEASELYDTAKKLPANNKCTSQTIPCNTSLQLLAASSVRLIKPNFESQPIRTDHTSFASQIFVFQEPDPPRAA